MATMTELKRKREDVDDGKSEDEVAGTNDIAPTQSTSSSPSSQSTPPTPPQCSSEEEGEVRSHGDGSAPSTRVVSVAADKADKPAAKSAATDRQTILICGKEVVLKSTGGRKRRKHPIETLVILAYKSRLAITCQANDMVGALEIHREMKNKGVKQDLSVSFFQGVDCLLLPSLVYACVPSDLPRCAVKWRAIRARGCTSEYSTE